MPNIAGASMATPRAWPSFSVATPSLLTKVCSTAASIGLEIAEHGGEPFMDREQPARQRQIVRRLHRAAADEDQPVALGLDHAPAGAAQAGVDADDPDGLANRGRCHGL